MVQDGTMGYRQMEQQETDSDKTSKKFKKRIKWENVSKRIWL